MSEESEKAIESVKHSEMAFCKFLSANDSGETGGHQSGILVSKKAFFMMFPGQEIPHTGILKKTVKIMWPDGKIRDDVFTYYTSKRELRITSFGRNFPFLRLDQTGSLFVFTKQDDEDYTGFFLDDADESDEFLDFFGLSSTETNALIDYHGLDYKEPQKMLPKKMKFEDINIYAEALLKSCNGFPSTTRMSEAARKRWKDILHGKVTICSNPDAQLLNWTGEEFKLFRAVENVEYMPYLNHGFENVDEFVLIANTVLNRRKSRAGKSLENQLATLFDGNRLQYTPQAITEGNKKPDFIFPSQELYHNMAFPPDKLISLAAKTTCKDRWRQVITEADRIPVHYLCTLQQGVSAAQMDEMQSENVVLVVPKEYIRAYPKDRQNRIWTLKHFIDYVKETEGIA